MSRPCPSPQHRWRLAECLPLTLPDTSGWVRVLLRRVCRVCAADEVWAGRVHVAKERVQLLREEE